jgi:hypothetical protein
LSPRLRIAMLIVGRSRTYVSWSAHNQKVLEGR